MSTIKIAKIEPLSLTQKHIIQPYALRTNYLHSPVPALTSTGIVLSMTPQPLPPAKINVYGDMQTNVKYSATQLTLLDRYVEVEVLEDLGDEWIGMLFGFNVQGSGGAGDVRGCKVSRIEDGVIHVKGFNQRGNKAWQKVKTIVDAKINGNEDE